MATFLQKTGSLVRCSSSLVPQRVNGVGPRDLDGVADHRRDGDADCNRRREDEWNGAELNALVKAVEPRPHEPPGDGPGNEIRKDDRAAELPHEQPDDVARARAEHLPDADFLRPSRGYERGQPEQAEGCDADRQKAESKENGAAAFVLPVKLRHEIFG